MTVNFHSLDVENNHYLQPNSHFAVIFVWHCSTLLDMDYISVRRDETISYSIILLDSSLYGLI